MPNHTENTTMQKLTAEQIELCLTHADTAIRKDFAERKDYKPTPEQMKLWQSTGRAIWKEFDAKIDKPLLKLVLDAQAK